MIKIEFVLQNGQIGGFSVKGHSGTAERGADIVCAGVSSLAQTALLGLMRQINAAVDYKVTGGDMSVFLQDAPTELTEAVLQTMRLGLIEIAKQYPQAVKIKETGR